MNIIGICRPLSHETRFSIMRRLKDAQRDFPLPDSRLSRSVVQKAAQACVPQRVSFV